MTAVTIARARLSRDSTVLLLIDYQVGPLWEPEAAHLRREVVALARVATHWAAVVHAWRRADPIFAERARHAASRLTALAGR